MDRLFGKEQRFEAGADTTNSSYALKYFGRNKDVVSYSTLINYVLKDTRIIRANKRESHCVFDTCKIPSFSHDLADN